LINHPEQTLSTPTITKGCHNTVIEWKKEVNNGVLFISINVEIAASSALTCGV
jgi:hypothetical protein